MEAAPALFIRAGPPIEPSFGTAAVPSAVLPTNSGPVRRVVSGNTMAGDGNDDAHDAAAEVERKAPPPPPLPPLPVLLQKGGTRQGSKDSATSSASVSAPSSGRPVSWSNQALLVGGAGAVGSARGGGNSSGRGQQQSHNSSARTSARPPVQSVEGAGQEIGEAGVGGVPESTDATHAEEQQEEAQLLSEVLADMDAAQTLAGADHSIKTQLPGPVRNEVPPLPPLPVSPKAAHQQRQHQQEEHSQPSSQPRPQRCPSLEQSAASAKRAAHMDHFVQNPAVPPAVPQEVSEGSSSPPGESSPRPKMVPPPPPPTSAEPSVQVAAPVLAPGPPLSPLRPRKPPNLTAKEGGGDEADEHKNSSSGAVDKGLDDVDDDHDDNGDDDQDQNANFGLGHFEDGQGPPFTDHVRNILSQRITQLPAGVGASLYQQSGPTDGDLPSQEASLLGQDSSGAPCVEHHSNRHPLPGAPVSEFQDDCAYGRGFYSMAENMEHEASTETRQSSSSVYRPCIVTEDWGEDCCQAASSGSTRGDDEEEIIGQRTGKQSKRKGSEEAISPARASGRGVCSPGSAISAFFNHRIVLPNSIATSDYQRAAFVTTPLAASSGSLAAMLVRLRGRGIFAKPTFALYAQQSSGPVFLAVASPVQTRAGSMSPCYAISVNERERHFDRKSPHYLGRLRGNLLSTHYTLLGKAIPEAAESSSSHLMAPATSAEEDLLMQLDFKKPSDAPRTMEVVLPVPHGGCSEPKPKQAWEEEANPYVQLTNAVPEYDAETNVYSIDFHGRVAKPSAKNFQLVRSDTSFVPWPGSHLCMQFGKAEEGVFHLDVGHPLSPLQAFALALPMFDPRPAEALRLYY